jgi:predicted phosphoribosyltransferase
MPADHPLRSETHGFEDRREAGRRLSALLESRRGERPVILGIPRGGVPVAAEVARALEAPLDVAVACKLGAPRNPEYAIGALAEGGVRVLGERVLRDVDLDDPRLQALISKVEGELEERVCRYRGGSTPAQIAGRTVMLVDDGLATGCSALAAVRSLRMRGAGRIVVAAPVASPGAVATLRKEGAEVTCVAIPDHLSAVGRWYEDFSPTADEEVVALLAEHAARRRGRPCGTPASNGARSMGPMRNE